MSLRPSQAAMATTEEAEELVAALTLVEVVANIEAMATTEVADEELAAASTVVVSRSSCKKRRNNMFY